MVIQDTREQNPLNFSFHGYEVIVKKLDAGDYSIDGYETVLFIERKASTGELANNLGKKYKTFIAELERAKNYKYKYLICEFSLEDVLDFPQRSGIPSSKIKQVRTSGKFLLKRLHELEENYGITILYCTNREEATSKVVEIIENVKKENSIN